MPVTDRFIRTASEGIHADRDGLYLRVHPTGRKVFVVRDQRGDRDRWITLGAYPALSLAEARQKAVELKQSASVSRRTVDEVFQDYYKHISRTYKRPEQVKRRYDVDLAPYVGKTAIHRLTRKAVSDALERIVERGSPVAANRTLADIKKLTAFAVERGWINTDPLLPLTRVAVGGREKSRERNLSFDEIHDALHHLYCTPSIGWTLYFILLTGCRATEAIWCLTHRTLEIPGEMAKTRPHSLPDVPAVRAVLKHAPPPPKDYRALNTALRKDGQTFTPHDLRRTFASRIADLGVAPHVIEKLLNHRMTGVMAVYNRAEYWPERIAAQRMWGRHLGALRRKKTPDSPGP